MTAVLWMFLCYQVLSRSGSRDEDNAFNLIEDVIIDDIKEVPIFLKVMLKGNVYIDKRKCNVLNAIYVIIGTP